MQIDWTTVTSAFVGGFLAAFTGYLFELRRESGRLKTVRDVLKTAISDDLKYSLVLYDKLNDEFQKTNTVWFSTINELRESRATYQNNKDWIAIFNDGELRRKIFRYYLQSADRINTLEYQQRRKYEIEGRMNETIRDIRMRDPSISHESAVQTAMTYMTNEATEYQNLEKRIAESVRALVDYRAVVKELLDAISRHK